MLLKGWDLVCRGGSLFPRPPSLALIGALALGGGLRLLRRARGVNVDRTVRSLGGHLLAQHREVVLSSADTRHVHTP